MEQLSEPERYHWLNYETDRFDRLAIVELIHKSVEFTIDHRELYCFCNPPEAYYERCHVEADRIIVREMENHMTFQGPRERHMLIVSIRRNLDTLEKQRMTLLD